MTSGPDASALFSSDRPISTRGEDKLGRGAFAAAISAAVRGWKGKDSLVMALYGPWGSGKSSIKNMVIESLRKDPSCAGVIDFNPWQVSNRAQLTEAFFDEIGIALSRGPIASKKDKKRTLDKLRLYSARLKSSGALIGLIIKPVRFVLFLSAILFWASSYRDTHYVTAIVVVLCLLAAALTWSSKVTEELAFFQEAGVEKGKKSLEDVKGDVRNELVRLRYPMLVVVDDLDRLTPAELLEMFQLIKANGDFPNVLYLLLFDRTVVESQLAQSIKSSGRDYLEKIVQVGFDVPLIERKRIHAVLTDGLDSLLSNPAVSRHFDEIRWGNLFVGVMQPYFDNLRQVNRFLSTLSFHVSLFRNDDGFEVNAIDLVGVELLRMFEPPLYHLLPKNKTLLTSASDFKKGSKEKQTEGIASMIEAVPPERQDRVKTLLLQLFPSAGRGLGGLHYGSDFGEVWSRELRVCSEGIFDRYFSLAVPEGELSQAAIERVLSLVGDRDELRSEFETLAAKGLLEAAMERLEAYKQEIPIRHAVPFITALFDVGDSLSDGKSGMFGVSPIMHADRVIYWFLRQEPDLAKRGDILKTAIAETTGVNLPTVFTQLQGQMANERPQGDEPIVSAEALQRLQQLCVARIESRAIGGAVLPNMAAMLTNWQKWGASNKPRQYSEELVQTPEGLSAFLRAFLSKSTSYGMGNFVGRHRWYMQRSVIERFVSFDLLTTELAKSSWRIELSDEDTLAIEAFKEAAERWRKGEPDYDPWS